MTGEPILNDSDLVDPTQPARALEAERAGAPESARGAPAERPGRRKAALGFIFATALMDVTAMGLIIPVLPKLVQGFVGGDPAQSAAHAAIVVGWFGFIFAAIQFFGAPIIGGLSDRFGRRPVLLISIFGLGFDYVLMALAPNLGWLFVGRMISGATAASFSTASAYIADVTPPEKRAASFGLMGTAFGAGFILGPGLGGFLGNVDPRLPFWAAAALALCNGLYGLFILPESLPKERRNPFSWRRANPLGSFRLYQSQPQLLGMAAVIFLFYLAHQVLQSTFVLYTSYRYAWTTATVGLSLVITGVGSIIVQTFVVKPFVARFGERGALYTGLSAGVLGFGIYATAQTGWEYWLGAPVFALMGLTGPGTQGIMTRLVSPREQGRLQGANSGVMAIAGLIGPLMFTRVFAWSIQPYPGRPGPGTAVYVASGLLLLGLIVALYVTRGLPERTAQGAPQPRRAAP